MQAGLNALLWFGAILALIPLVLWLLQRSPLGARLSGGGKAAMQGLPKPVAVLPLSPQHKVVTVEVGQGDDRLWLVLGVGPQGMRTLHTMQPGPLPALPAQPPPQAAFTQLLNRMRSGAPGAGEGPQASSADGRTGRRRRDHDDSQDGGWTAL